MTTTSEPSVLVLLAARLKSFSEASVLAEVCGLDESVVESELKTAEGAGFAMFRETPRKSGWMLTKEGRVEGEQRLAAELDAAGVRDEIQAAYEEFLTLNKPMLQLCTDWQLRTVDGEQVVNDHTDPAHDSAVIGTLAEHHVKVQPVCERLGNALGRFGAYENRLAESLAKVQAGDADYFTKPLIDSYHTIWFELHEDQLATLGIDRATEEA